jgi:YD repeat-containing protein
MNMIARFILIIILILAVLSSSSAYAATCVYDDLNRLTEVNYGNGQIIRYAYDATGNRITMQTEASKPAEHTAAPDCIITMDTYKNTCKDSWFSPPASFDESSDFRFTYGMIGDFIYISNYNDY